MPRQKGISPIVATTILILIAVTLSVIIFNWQSTTLRGFSTSFETATKEKLQCQRGSIAVFSAAYECNAQCAEGTDHTISLTLHNPGDVVLNPRFIYLKARNGALYELGTSGELGLGQSLIFQNTTKDSCTAISRNVDEVIVTTDCPEVVGSFPGSSIIWNNCP
jgi:flagellin-like protein